MAYTLNIYKDYIELINDKNILIEIKEITNENTTEIENNNFYVIKNDLFTKYYIKNIINLNIYYKYNVKNDFQIINIAYIFQNIQNIICLNNDNTLIYKLKYVNKFSYDYLDEINILIHNSATLNLYIDAYSMLFNNILFNKSLNTKYYLNLYIKRLKILNITSKDYLILIDNYIIMNNKNIDMELIQNKQYIINIQSNNLINEVILNNDNTFMKFISTDSFHNLISNDELCLNKLTINSFVFFNNYY